MSLPLISAQGLLLELYIQDTCWAPHPVDRERLAIMTSEEMMGAQAGVVVFKKAEKSESGRH